MKPSTLLIGIASGLASALLFAGLVLQSATAIGLSLAASLPIFIASFGWGSAAGAIAAVSGAILLSLFTGSPASGVILFATMALPAAVVGHFAGLARPADEDAAVPYGRAPALEWYPLDRVLLILTLMVVAACLFVGWLVGFDPEQIAPAVAAALSAQAAGSPEQIAELSRFVVRLVPFVQPAMLVTTLVICLYLAAAIARISGRLPRPKDDIPTAAGLPRLSLGLFALGIAGCFLDGLIGSAASVLTGAFAAAFALVGLAAIHRRTRGRSARGLLLFTNYAAILLLSFPLVAIAALGMFETASRSAPASRR
ncbi:hypothetical protein [Mangrovicella endophytica]|uniref:hypothetical protein n=1 Tax=Mangrovicella endophytica TaxID=2066697 RepID=UPI000C9DB60F|nr:hypothetical protein [Mangrovicella endophytica]